VQHVLVLTVFIEEKIPRRMSKLTVHKDGQQYDDVFSAGDNLLQLLQKDFVIEAPCGGNGTCGKCRVKVKDHGIVTACTFYPDADIEVYMPNEQESKILTTQYNDILKLPLTRDSIARNSTYPVGLALDIGTTSVVFYWVSLITGAVIQTNGIANPQVKYGADVISRISFCTSGNGLDKLQHELILLINDQIGVFTKQHGISKTDITKITVAANTTMLHLLARVDPSSMATAPYTPTFTESRVLSSESLGIKCHPKANIYLLPSVSAFVGADVLAGLSALSPPDIIRNYLFIDIGTNGEMALVTPKQIYCCATAAGPAFEGANISCGMGAFNGAISAYGATGCQTISDEKPRGICGSGLIDCVAYLLDENMISSDGLLESQYVLADEKASGTGKPIVITPHDIREVQLAKSAIASGICILMEIAGLSFDSIDALYLAGGFGNYLNPVSAARIGLLPIELIDRIIPVGNTSGAGAVLALQSDLFADVIKTKLDMMAHIELSEHANFEMEFAMNMYF